MCRIPLIFTLRLGAGDSPGLELFRSVPSLADRVVLGDSACCGSVSPPGLPTALP